MFSIKWFSKKPRDELQLRTQTIKNGATWKTNPLNKLQNNRETNDTNHPPAIKFGFFNFVNLSAKSRGSVRLLLQMGHYVIFILLYFIILQLIKTTSEPFCLLPSFFDLVCSHTGVLGFTHYGDGSGCESLDVWPWTFSPDPEIRRYQLLKSPSADLSLLTDIAIDVTRL